MGVSSGVGSTSGDGIGSGSIAGGGSGIAIGVGSTAGGIDGEGVGSGVDCSGCWGRLRLRSRTYGRFRVGVAKVDSDVGEGVGTLGLGDGSELGEAIGVG
jgi:hypothetical protein